MKLPLETREKLLMMASSIKANQMSQTEAAAYAAELRIVVEENGGVPNGVEPEAARQFQLTE